MLYWLQESDKSELTGGMRMEVAVVIVVLLLSIACAVISVFQFKEKGVLFNNAYLFASKQEQETMDKKPHYRQSGIVFAFLSSIFLCIAAECVLKTGWLWWIEGALCIVVLAYAITSSVKTIRK